MNEKEKLDKILEIVERALRSSDPINLYKAQALEDIYKILGGEVKTQIEEPEEDENQITIDDIIRDPLFLATRAESIRRLGY